MALKKKIPVKIQQKTTPKNETKKRHDLGFEKIAGFSI
jgi:hypothetical protein